jgi:hypothetical protein
MRRFFLIIAVILSLPAKNMAQPSVTFDCSNQWGAGRYNKVQVSITFSTRQGFARFSQEFPVGFEILKDNVPDGDFFVSGTTINVVWMKIPQKGKTEFSFFVKPEAGIDENVSLGGMLAVIIKGVQKQVTHPVERTIEITGAGGILPADMEKIKTEKNGIKAAEPPADRNTVQGNIVFRVQVSSSSKQIPPDKLRKDLGIDAGIKITSVKSGNIYKYQAGEFADYESAYRLLAVLKKKGITDAFIVAYRGSDQLPVEKARNNR